MYFLLHGGPDTKSFRKLIALQYQQVLDAGAIFLAFICLLKASYRPLVPVIPLAGWLTFFGYLWFIATSDEYLTSGVRLLYPAIVIFLVLGEALQKLPLFFRFIPILLLILITFIEAALATSGYPVV